MIVPGIVVPAGILLPEAILGTELFAILATFVAINTVMYVALAVAKILPKVYLADLIRRSNERAETRSIHPENSRSRAKSR